MKYKYVVQALSKAMLKHSRDAAVLEAKENSDRTTSVSQVLQTAPPDVPPQNDWGRRPLAVSKTPAAWGCFPWHKNGLCDDAQWVAHD